MRTEEKKVRRKSRVMRGINECFEVKGEGRGRGVEDGIDEGTQIRGVSSYVGCKWGRGGGEFRCPSIRCTFSREC